MPSPFSGMDPWLEGDEWEDFRSRFNLAISDALQPGIEPNYVVRVERRVYVEQMSDELLSSRQPDVAILDPGLGTGLSASPHAGVATTVPVKCQLALPEERREIFLVIRHRPSMEIVAVIETQSPSNKRRGSEGQRQYQTKRLSVLQSPVHLVEFDLLRGGERMPMLSRLPPGDYYALVSRADERPRCDVYSWTIRQTFPTISIPLQNGDADVVLDLQGVFAAMYDRARYDLSLNYSEPLSPPLGEDDAAWARQRTARSDAS